MREIAFEGEGPSLQEVHGHIMSEEAVTFRQQYPGEYETAVHASGFRKLTLPAAVIPNVTQLESIQSILGLRTYFGPNEESGVALSGVVLYYQAKSPALSSQA